MEIGAITSALSLADTQTKVGTQVMAMGLDQLRTEGNEMQKMLEMSVNPGVGSRIDVSV